MTDYLLKGGWHLSLDPDHPTETVIGRADGRFFKVRFNTTGHGQPVLDEVCNDEGVAGFVIPVVRKVGGKWQVAVSNNFRPANDYSESLIEGSRKSVSNDDPNISTDGFTIKWLSGFKYSNSARITGKLKFGIVDLSDTNTPLPKGAGWMDVGDFFTTSTDALTMAALGQFMTEILRLI